MLKERLIYYLVCIFILLLVFSSCKKYDEDGFRIYTIKENKRSSSKKIKLSLKSELNFYAKFDSSAIYYMNDASNQDRFHVLHGFSDCFSPTDKNSARFGWRWFKETLQIFALSKENGDVHWVYLDTVSLKNKAYQYHLSIDKDEYVFLFKGKITRLPRGCNRKGPKFLLFPYFGSVEKAPHEMTFKIKEI